MHRGRSLFRLIFTLPLSLQADEGDLFVLRDESASTHGMRQKHKDNTAFPAFPQLNCQTSLRKSLKCLFTKRLACLRTSSAILVPSSKRSFSYFLDSPAKSSGSSFGPARQVIVALNKIRKFKQGRCFHNQIITIMKSKINDAILKSQICRHCLTLRFFQ